jgi:aspartate beta-hydroxylase
VHELAEPIDATLIERGAAQRLHGSRSLHQHLTSTSAILEGWGEPDAVRLAGLMHCAYSTDPPLFALAERDDVRRLIGAHAERLVFACRCEDDAATAPEDRRDLAAIRLAALAAESCAPSGSPSPWLSRASAIARSIRERPVPVFRAGSERVEPDAEAHLVETYGGAWAAPLDPAADELRHAAEAIPFVAEPFIFLGLIAIAKRDFAAAARYAEIARELLFAWGTSWDKRLPETGWLAIVVFLAQAATAPAAESALLATLVRELLERPNLGPEIVYVRLDALDLLPIAAPLEGPADRHAPAVHEADDIFCADDLQLVPPRFAEFLDGLLDDEPRRALAMYPGLRSRPWWDPADFPIVAALEAAAPAIAAEFAALDPAQFHSEAERIEREGEWDVFLLFERGRRRAERCALVPITAGIIEAHATLRTQAGLAYFSRLAPGSIVAPHRGPTNVRLRCHHGISVPGDCGIDVDGRTRTWEAGKCLIFDDSLSHTVWNSSDRERVVLIIDLWHPDLEPEEIALLSGLHRYGMSVAESLTRYWEKNDRALVAAG